MRALCINYWPLFNFFGKDSYINGKNGDASKLSCLESAVSCLNCKYRTFITIEWMPSKYLKIQCNYYKCKKGKIYVWHLI